MLLQIVIISHFLGTLWHLLAYIEIQFGENDTWVQQQDLVDQSWQIRYIQAFYSALATCLLIGSGGPTPIEQVCVIIFLFGTIGVFAYILSNISLIIEEINKKSYEYKHDMELINTYMRQNNIEQKTQVKIRCYLEYVYQDREKMKQNISVKEVLNKLPKYLNDEIIQEINYKLLSKIHFLKANFSKETLNKIALNSQETNHVTNDIILDEDIINNQNCNYLYIIKHGKVDICFENLNNQLVEVSQLEQGSIFGDINFITEMNQKIIIKSSSFVTLLKIQKTDFIKIVRLNQIDYEKYMYLKEQIIQDGKTDLYTRKCGICQSVYHYEQQCRLFCYKPYKLISIQKFQRKEQQEQCRGRYFRPQRQYRKSLQNFEILSQVSKYVQENAKYRDYLNEYESYIVENLMEHLQQVVQDDQNFISDQFQTMSFQHNNSKNYSLNNFNQSDLSSSSGDSSEIDTQFYDKKDEVFENKDKEIDQKQENNNKKYSIKNTQLNENSVVLSKSKRKSQINQNSNKKRSTIKQQEQLKVRLSQANLVNQILLQKIQQNPQINEQRFSYLQNQQRQSYVQQNLSNLHIDSNFNQIPSQNNMQLQSNEDNISKINSQIRSSIDNSFNLQCNNNNNNNNFQKNSLINQNRQSILTTINNLQKQRQSYMVQNGFNRASQIQNSDLDNKKSVLIENNPQSQLFQQKMEENQVEINNNQNQTIFCYDMQEKYNNYQIFYPSYNMKTVIKRYQRYIDNLESSKQEQNGRQQINKKKTYMGNEKSLYDIQMKFK